MCIDRNGEAGEPIEPDQEVIMEDYRRRAQWINQPSRMMGAIRAQQEIDDEDSEHAPEA